MMWVASHTPAGCFVEIGVFKGGTAWHLDNLGSIQRRYVYLYDTFEGMPYAEECDSHKLGDFKECDYQTVKSLMVHSEVIKGIFPNSAVPMTKIAFAHIDCDQYRSVIESARYLTPLMTEGGIMWFDDSPCLPGSEKAVKELFGDRIQLSPTNQHFVVF